MHAGAIGLAGSIVNQIRGYGQRHDSIGIRPHVEGQADGCGRSINPIAGRRRRENGGPGGAGSHPIPEGGTADSPAGDGVADRRHIGVGRSQGNRETGSQGVVQRALAIGRAKREPAGFPRPRIVGVLVCRKDIAHGKVQGLTRHHIRKRREINPLPEIFDTVHKSVEMK